MKRGDSGAPEGISRREFARRAAAAAAGVAIAPTDLIAGTERTGQGTSTPEADAEIEAKVQAILRKYGERLSEEQKTEIRRLVTEGQKPLVGMREYALNSLHNGDQPANVMKIYPDTAAPHRAPVR